MFYDIFKIVKKCLKLWYVFVATLVIGVSATFLSVKPLKTYSSSFNIKTEYLSREKLWNEFYSWDVYDELKQKVLNSVTSNYFKDNEEEIKNALNLTDEDISFSVGFSISGSYSVLSVYSRSNDSEVCKKVIEYVKDDIIPYLEQKIDENIEDKYRITTVKSVSKPADITSTINKKLMYGIAGVVVAMLVELFVIGFLALCKKTIETEGEIESDFNARVIIKDYESRIKELETILKKNKSFKDNTVLISGDVKTVSEKVKTGKVNYKEIQDVLTIESFNDIEETAFVIEVIKGKTLKKDVAKILKNLETLNYTDICFITRKEINSDESTSGK